MIDKSFISRFSPGLMSPETLEAIFVQREELATRLVELIQESASSGSKHHNLLVGPRGIGKTHLVALAYHRIKAMEPAPNLRIAWLREDEWGVGSLLDLLLRLLGVFLEEHPDAEAAARVDALYSLGPEQAEEAAASLLQELLGDATLLVLVENLHDVFKGLGSDGQKRLRALIQERPRWSILATTQSLFSGVSMRTSPFYGFFHIHHLQDLNLDDATEMLANIAEVNADQELADFLRKPAGRARVRAVHHLAGGNPRVYTIFSQFLTRDSMDQLVDAFMRTLDDLTPYYQSRMAMLSPQQRKIVERLCEARHAVPVKHLASRCFLSHQTTSSQLRQLREKGYVHTHPVGRESYYELREPLMRLCLEVKKHRGKPIRLFVEILKIWHTRTELLQLLAALENEVSLEKEYLLEAIEGMKDSENPVVAGCRKDLKALVNKRDFEKSLGVCDELIAIRGIEVDWLSKASVLVQLGRFQEVERYLAKADQLISEMSYPNKLAILVLKFRGNISMSLIGQGKIREHCEFALECFETAVRLGDDSNETLALREHCKEMLGGLDSLQQVLENMFSEEQTGETLPAVKKESSKLLSVNALSLVDAEFIRTMITETISESELSLNPEVVGQAKTVLEMLIILFSIPSLVTSAVSNQLALQWRDSWASIATGNTELDMPLRLLEAVVRYKENPDPQILLGLAAEERALLEPLLTPDGEKASLLPQT